MFDGPYLCAFEKEKNIFGGVLSDLCCVMYIPLPTFLETGISINLPPSTLVVALLFLKYDIPVPEPNFSS